MNRSDLVIGRLRELGTVGLVAGLSGAYAAVLITASDSLDVMASTDGEDPGVLLGAVATVFILIALYVAAVVITNCVSTVTAGRLRQIALLRLLGASSRDLRRAIALSTAKVGLLGAFTGLVVGTVIADLGRVALVQRGTIPDLAYSIFAPGALLAVAAICASALIAGWAGARTVLTFSPAEAMTGAAYDSAPTTRASVLRGIGAVLLLLAGAGLLVVAAQMGERETNDGTGFILAFFGSVVSGTGILVGGTFIVPTAVALLSRLLGSGAPNTIAARNAVKDPRRTTRSTMGLVIGVALVTTFSAGATTLQAAVATWDLSVEDAATAKQYLAVAMSVMIGIVVISAVIAAVGFVSTMSLTVIQRGREIGLLRALGFTTAQVRTMISFEAVALSVAAVVLGVMLGVIYGAVGAQALVGDKSTSFVLGVPWGVLAAIAVASFALVVVASRGPARRAVQMTPIDASRIDA